MGIFVGTRRQAQVFEAGDGFALVAKGKVVVATADGQVVCFGSRQTPTVDSVSPKGGYFPLP